MAAHLRDYPAGPDGLAFTLEGEPITRQALGHLWRPVMKAAGMPAGTGFHSLRHYYASLLIRHGERQDGTGAPGARERNRDAGHVLAPLADSDDQTHEAIDVVLGPAEDSMRTEEAM